MSSVGQGVGGLVGGVIGFFIGGPTGAYYGAQAGMMIGGAIDPPKGPTINGPRLNDLSVQTSTYGAPIPRNYGTIAQTGNVFWLQGDKLTEVQTVTESGGKGGPVTTTKTWSYYATFAVGLCQGPIDGVRRIWIGGQLWYDAGSDDIATIIASNQKSDLFTLYLGTDTQTADPLIQADKGVANVPAYRGLAYIVFDALPLEKYSNSLMGAQVKAEIIKIGSRSYVSTSKIINNAAWPLNQWAAAATLDTTVVAVSLSSNLCAYSLDGNNWTTTYLPSTGDWACVASKPGLFVAVQRNTNQTATSPDGIRWTAGTTLPGLPLDARKLIWTGSFFCLISFSTTRVFISADGFNWVEGALPTTTYSYWIDVAWNGSTLCAIQKNSDVAAVSTNGLTWTQTTLPVSDYWTAIASDGETFVAVTGTKLDAKSVDGVTWTGGSTMVITNGTVSGVGTEWKLAFNGSAFIVATGSSTKYLISEDAGATWTIFTAQHTMSSFPAITSYNGIFLSVIVNGDAEFIYKDMTSQSAVLGDIVQTECLTSNILTAGDLDVTELTDTVRGYRISQLGAIRGALDPLRAAFPFDVVQHGYQIKFVRRGGASVASIPTSSLDARAAGAEPGVQVTDAREMDLMLPRKVSVNYVDVTREYETNQQSYERINTDAIGERAVEMPIVFSAAEAAQIAEMLTYLYWMERHDVAFVLPPEYDNLEPADVITLTGTDATWELRLLSTNTLPDGRIESRAKYNKAAIYTPVARGEEGQSTGGLLTLAGPCVYSLLDIPLMRDDDDTAGFPVAMAGYLSGWPGGILYRSDDSGQTWTDLRAFAPGAVIGYATTSLAAHGGTVYDFASTLAVILHSGTLSSVTEAQLFAGQNWFAYGADGRWEIIAARTATLQGDGSYVLQDFLRGQHGTEWATGLHAVNDTLVLLSATALSLISVNASSIGSARTYRAITTGKSLDSDTDLSFTYTGVNLECLSPVALTGNRHPSTNDWTLTWTRRSRYADWRDYIDAPLGETSESYEIDIFSSGTYTTLKRTLTASSPTAAYTSAQQVTDFGSNQATLYVKVYQLSATVGRGYALTQSITR